MGIAKATIGVKDQDSIRWIGKQYCSDGVTVGIGIIGQYTCNSSCKSCYSSCFTYCDLIRYPNWRYSKCNSYSSRRTVAITIKDCVGEGICCRCRGTIVCIAKCAIGVNNCTAVGWIRRQSSTCSNGTTFRIIIIIH